MGKIPSKTDRHEELIALRRKMDRKQQERRKRIRKLYRKLSKQGLFE